MLSMITIRNRPLWLFNIPKQELEPLMTSAYDDKDQFFQLDLFVVLMTPTCDNKINYFS